MIADPPFDVGAVQEIKACALSGVALTEVGAPGIVRGVIAADAVDGRELPASLIATTVKVYEVPLLNPEKVQVSALMLVQFAGAATDGEEVTV